MDLSRCRLFAFDLDGTLIDSRLDLVHAVNATLARERLPALAEDVVVSFIGDGAEELLLRSLAAAGLSGEEAARRLPDVLSWFLSWYGEHCLDRTVLHPGAEELLDRLSDRHLAVLTNKPEAPTLRILAHFGLLPRFARVVAGDGPHGQKPDPGGLAYIMASMRVSPEETVLIGDGMQDLLAARAAGTRFIAFTGGLGDATAMASAAPDLTVDHLAGIARLIRGRP